MHIRSATPADIPILAEHKLRHSLENGRDGDVVFAPSEQPCPVKDEDVKRDIEALLKPSSTSGWQRIWILTDEKQILGEVTLTNLPSLPSASHRCMLIIGVERVARSQGWGSKLMIEAINWAKQQPNLEWISLYVFENNPRAKALYKALGFAEAGTIKDMFRTFGQSLDETVMVLKLR